MKQRLTSVHSMRGARAVQPTTVRPLQGTDSTIKEKIEISIQIIDELSDTDSRIIKLRQLIREIWHDYNCYRGAAVPEADYSIAYYHV